MFLLLSKFLALFSKQTRAQMAFLGTFWLSKLAGDKPKPGARARSWGPAPGTGALQAPAWPGTHRCRAAGTARTPRSGPWRVTAPPRLRLTGPLRSCARPSARRRPPARSSRPRARQSPHLLPARARAGRPALAAAKPAQRMPVIPLCRLAGVRGHREKRGGQGRQGAEERKEQSPGVRVRVCVRDVGPAAR